MRPARSGELGRFFRLFWNPSQILNIPPLRAREVQQLFDAAVRHYRLEGLETTPASKWRCASGNFINPDPGHGADRSGLLWCFAVGDFRAAGFRKFAEVLESVGPWGLDDYLQERSFDNLIYK
jgi:hypothetical protein